MSNTTVLEAAVDWVTATAQTGEGVNRLMGWSTTLMEREIAKGNKPRDFKLYGYEGVHVGSLSCGKRPGGALLQISGAAAAAEFPLIFAVCERITRLDLQVTARCNPFNPRHAAQSYAHRPSTLPGKGKPPEYTFFENSEGGATLYVGKGSSQQMGRMYNKAHESNDAHYRDCWRWEVQLRDDMAGKTADGLQGSIGHGGDIGGFVWGWFDARGMTPLFNQAETWGTEPPKRPKTDIEHKLEWLRNAVRPTCDYLRDCERTSAMLAALGLTDLIDPTSLPEASAAAGDCETDEQEGAHDAE